MVWILLLVILAVIGFGLWRLAVRAEEIDEDLKYMNEDHPGVGRGLLGILRRR